MNRTLLNVCLLTVAGAAHAQSAPAKFTPSWHLNGYLQIRFDTLMGDSGAFVSNGVGGTGPRPSIGGPAVGGPSSDFMVRRGRLRFSGEVAPDQEFVAQLDLGSIAAVNLRDAYFVWKGFPDRNLTLTAGQFVQPFGYELRTSSRTRESAERAMAFCDSGNGFVLFKQGVNALGGVVTAGSTVPMFLNQDRDMGAQIDWLAPGPKARPTHLTVGLFNGEGRDAAGMRNQNGVMDLVARAETSLPQGKSKLALGVSAYHGALAVRGGAPVNGVPVAFRNADRDLWGADARWTDPHGRELRAEVMAGRVEMTPDRAQFLPGNRVRGGYLLGIHPLTPTSSLAVKYDLFDPVANHDRVVAGVRGGDLQRKAISAIYRRRLRSNTLFRMTYSQGLTPYDPSATGPLHSRISLVSTELQVEF